MEIIAARERIHYQTVDGNRVRVRVTEVMEAGKLRFQTGKQVHPRSFFYRPSYFNQNRRSFQVTRGECEFFAIMSGKLANSE